MKSAKEWRKSRYFGNNSEDGIETIIKQIQLDAIKEGMRRAAVVLNKEYHTATSQDLFKSRAHASILSTADALTEKNLSAD